MSRMSSCSVNVDSGLLSAVEALILLKSKSENLVVALEEVTVGACQFELFLSRTQQLESRVNLFAAPVTRQLRRPAVIVPLDVLRVESINILGALPQLIQDVSADHGEGNSTVWHG